MQAEHLIVAAVVRTPEWGKDYFGRAEPHWFEPPYDRLWQAASRVHQAGLEATPSNLYAYLDAGDQTPALHDIEALIRSDAVTALSHDGWARLMEALCERKEGAYFDQLLSQAHQGAGQLPLSERLQRVLFAVDEVRAKQTRDGGQARAFGSVLRGTLENMRQQVERGSAMIGMTTGFREFDHMTLGLESGALIIVAARPGMGKTTFVMNIATHIAGTAGPVKVHSLEMPAEQLVQRVIAAKGSIPLQSLRAARLTETQQARLRDVTTRFKKLPLFIDDRAGVDIDDLVATARAEHRRKRYACLVVDYLQLVSSRKGKNRTEEISDISRKLKNLAKELGIPVIALSQLNRSLEQRPDKRPVLSDLRESGQIEQDADIIVFLYRDEIYNPDTPDKGIAEAIIGKQRNGPVGHVRLVFDGACTRFTDVPRTAPNRGPDLDGQPDDGKRF